MKTLKVELDGSHTATVDVRVRIRVQGGESDNLQLIEDGGLLIEFGPRGNRCRKALTEQAIVDWVRRVLDDHAEGYALPGTKIEDVELIK